MERTDDISTITMPRWLIASTITLVVLRLVALPFESSKALNSPDPIHWIAASDFDTKMNPTGKLVLYEFGADWCEPVKRLESNVLRNKQIAGMISSRFVALKVRDRLREDGKNTQQVTDLEKKYHVFAFPTLVGVAQDGEAVASLVGSASALSTVHFLTRASRAGRNTVK